jgi:hypothetical protein
MLYRAYNTEPKFLYGNSIAMELGLILESEIVARLLTRGIVIQRRSELFKGVDNVPIVCHPDGFFTRDGKLKMLEVKTMGRERYLECFNFSIEKTRPDLVNQVQLYLHHAGSQLDVTEGEWLVMDRDTTDFFTESFTYDPEIAKALNSKIMIAKDAVDRQLEPEALSCSSEFLDRLLCPWRHLCGPIPPEISDKALEISASRFLDCKSIIDDCNDIIEVCRAAISSVMESRNLTSMKGYGITATMREERRTSTNWDAVKQLLDTDTGQDIREEALAGAENREGT